MESGRITASIHSVGSGHYTRLQIYLKRALEQGRQVQIFAKEENLRRIKRQFTPHLNKLQLIAFQRLMLITKNGVVDQERTNEANHAYLQYVRRETNKEWYREAVEEFNPDAIINDYDPLLIDAFSEHANENNIPLIQINHHSVLTRHEKTRTKNANPDVQQVKYLEGKSTTGIISSFFSPTHTDTFATHIGGVISPHNEAIPKKVRKKDHFVAYTSTGETNYKLLDILEKLRVKTYAFGYREKNYNHIKIEPINTSSARFIQVLSEAQGFFSRAGSMAITESLYFGVPIATNPIGNHIEQELNAYEVENQGYGICMAKPTQEAIEKFLDTRHTYRENILNDDQNKFNSNQAFIDVLEEKIAQR